MTTATATTKTTRARTSKKPTSAPAAAAQAVWTHPAPPHTTAHVGLNPENPASWVWRREAKRRELAAMSREDLMFDAVNVAFTNGWDHYHFTHRTPTEQLIECLLENDGFAFPAEEVARVNDAWADLPEGVPALRTLARERRVQAPKDADAETLARLILEAQFGPELVAVYYESYE